MSKKRRKKPSKPITQATEDFWDLGDDNLDLDDSPNDEKTSEKEKSSIAQPKSTQKKKATPSKPQESKQSKVSKNEDTKKKAGKKQSSKPKAIALSKPKIQSLKLTEDDDFWEVDEDEKTDQKKTSSEPEPSSKSQKTASSEKEPSYKAGEKTKTEPKLVRKSDPNSKESKKEVAPTTLLEKISLIVLLVGLFGALAWGISTFLGEAPQGEVIAFKEDYPAKGEHITVAAVETWWRKPIRSGENVDIGIVIEAELIPCAKITLTDGGSTTLRVSFRNGDQQLIGDTINLVVKDGKFTRNDSNTIDVFSTAGFEDALLINSYTNEDIDPWSLSIREGNASNNEEALVKTRISAESKN